jgi:hypothetical protein
VNRHRRKCTCPSSLKNGVQLILFQSRFHLAFIPSVHSMRIIPWCIVTLATCSSTLTDLAQLAKAASVPKVSAPRPASLAESPVVPKSLAAVKDSRWSSHPITVTDTTTSPVWKARVLVTMMIVCIAVAVAIAVVKSAKVLGLVTSDSIESMEAGFTRKVEDRDALSKLLSSRGSFFGGQKSN